jgi:hypothetical protein
MLLALSACARAPEGGAPPEASRSPLGAAAAENSRPGNSDWELSNPATGHEIEGYASSAAVAAGDSLALHVSTRSGRFDTRIYRLGWYAGAGARLLLEILGSEGRPQPLPEPRPGDGLTACRWPISLWVRTGPGWPSGVYLARLTDSGTGKQAFVPFVLREREVAAVRERAGGRRRAAAPAPYLMLLNTTTWQAYNDWGGKSLYDFNSRGQARALRVSYDRPYGSGPGAWRGLGAGELLTTPHTARKAGWEYPMIRWLERRGIDVAYAADLDLEADSTLLSGRRGVLIAGHPEYWSRGMRDALERARDRGTGLALLGANAGYWQIRLETSEEGAPARVLFCSKDHTRDSLFNTSADRDLTVRFRNLHPRRPEVALLGVMTARGEESVESDFVPAPEARGSWVYRGTGVASGKTRSLPGLVGYETDRAFQTDTLYGRWSPPGLTIAARSPIRFRDGTTETAEAATYRAPSGAVVFATGTVQWSWGLDDWGAPELRPRRRHPDAERITLNAIDALGGGAAPAPSSRSPR